MKNKDTVLFASFLLVITAVRFYLFYSIDMAKLVNIIPDDASYYYKIAENLALGYGLTFDSIHITNGVHPLWLILITPFFLLERLGINREIIFRILFLFQTVLQVSAAFLLFKAVRSFVNSNSAVIIAASFLYLIIIRFSNGLESALFFFMIALLIRYFISINKSSHWFVAGIIAGLCILTRLDFIFIVPVFIIISVIDYKTQKYLTLGSAAWFVLGVFILFLPYIIFNQIIFGHLIPISGALKAGTGFSFHSVLENFKFLYKPYMLVYPLASLYLIFYWSRINKVEDSSPVLKNYRFILLLLCLTVFLHSVHNAFFMKWGQFDWHFALYPATAIFILAEPVNYLINKFIRLQYLIVISFLILVIGFVYIRSASCKSYPKGWTEVIYDAAVWTRNNTFKNDILAMKDTGHFAFFSGREVINLDGLVNSFGYQEVLKEKKLNKYLAQNNTRYIVQHAFPGRNDIITGNYDTLSFPYSSHKYGVLSDPLLLSKKDEVYRSGLYNHEGEQMVLLIWKYNPR